MPKRRVARKGGWHGDSAGHRRAALKGHRRRVTPIGKTMLLIHHTTPKAARRIVNTRQWKDWTGSSSNLSYFVDWKQRREFSGFGKATVSVKVPRKRVTRRFRGKRVPVEFTVASRDLSGRPVRRIG